MRRIKMIVVIAVLALAIFAGWQVGSVEVANLELQEDMHDLASSQSSFRFGNTSTRSDDDFREAVIRKAKSYDIELKPEQVTVQRAESGNAQLYLAADYSVPVNVAQYSFVLHFTPSSTKRSF